MDIQTISVDPITGKVSFGLVSKSYTGAMKLAQVVILSLMNMPGKDVLDPSLGGGLPSLLGYNVGEETIDDIRGEIVRMVNKSADEIILSQTGLDIPASEKLGELRVLGVESGGAADSIRVRIRIVNESGKNIDVSL